jgi:hypothetical protein
MRLMTYTRSEIGLVPAMAEILVKIMAEFLCVLALATKWMNEGRLSKSILSVNAIGLTCHRKVCKETTRR